MMTLLATVALAVCGGSVRSANAAPTATTRATPSITPTATPAGPGEWTQAGALTQTTFAPSNPRIAYQVGPSGVLRSADGGATWSDLGSPTIPGLTPLLRPQLVSAFVSPANPNTLFMVLSAYSSGGCGQGAGAMESGAGGAGAPPGATTWCEVEYVSMDQGVTWSRAQTPVPGLMTWLAPNFADASIQGDMQRQGNRIYALVVNQTTGQNVSPLPAD